MSISILRESNPFIQRTNWFLGIGINNYIEFPKLYNAVKDVRDISQVLIDEYGFSPEHVLTLFDKEANEENVIGTLDDLADKLGKDDTLLIYYSGHGHMSNKGLGFWIPQDAKRGNTARYIPNSRIRDIIGTFDAQHVFLISDSCFSGSLLTKGTPRSTRLLRELDSSPSRWALCSGRGDEEVDDGIPGTNSPFASSIKNVLDHSTESEISVSKLIDRVREQVAANSRQIPEGYPIQDVGHAWGEYIFRKKTTVMAEGAAESEIAQPENSLEPNISQISPPAKSQFQQVELPQNQSPTPIPGNDSKLGRLYLAQWLKRNTKWVGIIVGAVLMTTVILLYATRDSLSLELGVEKNHIEVRALGGVPWISAGENEASANRLHAITGSNQKEGHYYLSISQSKGKILYSGMLAGNFNQRFGFLLFNDGEPGEYVFSLTDSLEHNVKKTFTIQSDYNPEFLIKDFQTCSHIQFYLNTQNPVPPVFDTLFNTGEFVYAYAQVMSEDNVQVYWQGAAKPHSCRKFPQNHTIVQYDSIMYDSPGEYTVQLWDGGNAILKELKFRVTNAVPSYEANEDLKLIMRQNGFEAHLIRIIESPDSIWEDRWLRMDSFLFKTGSSELKPESMIHIKNIVSILKGYPNVHLKIGVYTDNVGSADINLRLSSMRATAILSALIDNGADASRLSAVGYGEANPVATNNTAEGRAQNRRAALCITKK